ncbi:uncharacterized protein Dere_GG26269 [Drosophila erecta]|uniref:Uncharacterized protein n=1 Tax=Drosophila erecta TaxID=7220 RepID=A0A0Q5T4X1_DROER|nr:uncharacterized protein Dere_GG26269 [Drosophila erecta]
MVYFLQHVLTNFRVNLQEGPNFLGRSPACSVGSTYGIYGRLGLAFHEIFIGDDVAFGVSTFGRDFHTPLTYGCFTVHMDYPDLDDMIFSDSDDDY